MGNTIKAQSCNAMKLMIECFEGSVAICIDDRGSRHTLSRSLLPITCSKGDMIYVSVSYKADGDENVIEKIKQKMGLALDNS